MVHTNETKASEQMRRQGENIKCERKDKIKTEIISK